MWFCWGKAHQEGSPFKGVGSGSLSGVGILFLAEVIDGRLVLDGSFPSRNWLVFESAKKQKKKKRKTLTNVLLSRLLISSLNRYI